MSIPAAESWDLVREAAMAFRQWRHRHFARRAIPSEEGIERDMRRENFDAAILSPFASSILFSDAIQTFGLDASDDRNAP
ncbi:hypothetical protein PV773_06805 [Mesorhizobium sp. CC13]|uniref:hypothetical protein n=1 Tax=Mesorhizobium sp. CC13 TaxID=3029194 RepID=UPI0032639E33